MTEQKNEITNEQAAVLMDAQQVLASKQDVLMAIGRIQAFSNIKKYVTVTELITFKNIKDSKQYKGLVYKDDNNKSVTVTDLKDICRIFFNRSYESMTQDLKNLEIFGQEFLESSQAMELGYREIRKLRQLSHEEQQVVINSEEFDLGDKDAVKEKIEDLTFQHATQTAELKKELKEANETVEAVRENSNAKQAQLDQAKELEAKRKFSQTPWKHDVLDYAQGMMKARVLIEQGTNQLRDMFAAFTSDDTNLDEKAINYIARTLLAEVNTSNNLVSEFSNDVFGLLGASFQADLSAADAYTELSELSDNIATEDSE